MKWWITISILMFLRPMAANADDPARWRDFTLVTEDGQYVFVMLAPTDNNTTAYYSCAEAQHFPGAEDQTIRAKYPQSGLYLNDGSSTPLWTVDWGAFEDDIWIHPDGHYLVRLGPWACTEDYDELAITFYEDGQEIQHYAVEDLVYDPTLLPRSVSHYEWLAKASHSEWSDSFFSLLTITGEKYTFEVRTGRITALAYFPIVLEAELVSKESEMEALPECGTLSVIVQREYRLSRILYGTSASEAGDLVSVAVLCPEFYQPAELGEDYTLYLAEIDQQICPLWGEAFPIEDGTAYCAGEID